MQEKFNLSKDAIITFRRANSKREGCAEHIIKSHVNQINDEYINKIIKAINTPENIEFIGITKNNQNRYNLSVFDHSNRKYNVFMNVYIDEESKKIYEIVSAHFKKEKKK